MPLSYKAAGVDISAADRAKRAMRRSLATGDKRVLNAPGAFASLVEGRFPGIRHPVLVLKTEEPGSKQKLAIEHRRYRSIGADMIGHLINDIAVMGASPVAVQDAIICGKLDEKVVGELVRGIADACRAQGCVLTGGETSEQPGVIPAGTYVLTASVVGVAEKSEIVDGSAIREGDLVLAVASNGLHTNGYSLIRRLLERRPRLARKNVGGRTFLEVILRPHLCYYRSLRGIFGKRGLHGLAHITGGGIAGNLNRILPRTLDASIDLATLRIPPVFGVIKREGSVPDADMLRTFNVGVGLTIVCAPGAAAKIRRHLERRGHRCYPIGRIVRGKGAVSLTGKLRWP